MSGIVGLSRAGGAPAPAASLRAMLATLSHRGPDAADIWCEGPCGLGQAALWTTPLCAHHPQPLRDASCGLTLVADARLDHRQELAQDLGLSPRDLQDLGDAELILRAWRTWGPECLPRLQGDFAFAIWDSRHQRLVCARDPFGVKPLFWCQPPGSLAFASEIKGLWDAPGMVPHVNPSKLAEYVAHRFDDTTGTWFEGVQRLPPGHALSFEGGAVRTWRYWTLDSSRELLLESNEAYAERFSELFAAAVKSRLPTRGRLGTTLSGGLDSSSISCVAAGLLESQGAPPLQTYSAVFPSLYDVDPRIEEHSYIDLVLDSGAFEPHDVHVDECNPLADQLWQDDEPIPAPNFYMDCALFEAAHRHGARVLLSGNDGDSTVSYGYEHLEHLARRLRWLALLRISAALARNYGQGTRRILWQFGFKPALPRALSHLRRALRGGPSAWLADTAINGRFARDVVAPRIQELDANQEHSRNPHGQHAQAVTSGLLTYLLEILDKVSARCGIENRYPFFDRRLVEFCVATPSSQKILQGWPRSLQRRGMQGVLPAGIQKRRHKGNLSVSFNTRLLACNRDVLADVCLDRPQAIAPYADLAALRAAFQRYEADPAHGGQDALCVFTWAVLGLWLRQVS